MSQNKTSKFVNFKHWLINYADLGDVIMAVLFLSLLSVYWLLPIIMGVMQEPNTTMFVIKILITIACICNIIIRFRDIHDSWSNYLTNNKIIEDWYKNKV
ncbi:MAG: hypothetical protein PHN19_05155 [Patescibacteria group bacterium]|nr:hypothetical protein [Patescibacteria group bacterium]